MTERALWRYAWPRAVFGGIFVVACVVLFIWAIGDHSKDNRQRQIVSTAQSTDVLPLAIAMVRQNLAARSWGASHDCLQMHTKYGKGPFEASLESPGVVQVTHVVEPGGKYIWEVYIDAKVVDPVQKPIEANC